MAGSFGAAGEATDAIFSLTVGADGVDATSFEADGALPAAATGGLGAAAWSTGAAAAFCAGGGSVREATSSSSRLDLKPLNKSEPERLGADICRQDSLSQSFGASMRILCPPIWRATELPAWAAVLAISNAARRESFFMRI